jgi:hypothetical protein
MSHGLFPGALVLTCTFGLVNYCLNLKQIDRPLTMAPLTNSTFKINNTQFCPCKFHDRKRPLVTTFPSDPRIGWKHLKTPGVLSGFAPSTRERCQINIRLVSLKDVVNPVTAMKR